MNGYQPPIGYIVEGHSEEKCFGFLFSQVAKGWDEKTPVVAKADNNGDLIHNLKEHLTHINYFKPKSILICPDFRDAKRRENIFRTCNELKIYIEGQITEWLDDNNLENPPIIKTVIIIQQFESWLLSDMDALKRICRKSDLTQYGCLEEWDNVDEDIQNPAKVIRCLLGNTRYKRPNYVISILQHYTIATMERYSKSFNRFSRESKNSIIIYNSTCS